MLFLVKKEKSFFKDLKTFSIILGKYKMMIVESFQYYKSHINDNYISNLLISSYSLKVILSIYLILSILMLFSLSFPKFMYVK